MTLAQSDSTYVNSCLSSNAFRPVTIHAFLCFFITKLCVTKTQVSNVVLVDDSLGLLTLKGANLCVLRLCESGCTTFSCYTCTRWRMQVDVKSEVNVSATKGKDSLIPLNKIIPSSPLKRLSVETHQPHMKLPLPNCYVLTCLCVRWNTNFGCSDTHMEYHVMWKY
jgi:hypothetical protein